MDFIIWIMSGQSNGTDKRKLVLLSTWSQDWSESGSEDGEK